MGYGNLKARRSSQGEPNDIYWNPFAGQSGPASSSALRVSESRADTRLAIRRRGSDSTVKRVNGGDLDNPGSYGSAGSSHSRSRTLDDGAVASSSGANLHPLASGIQSSGSSSGLTLHDTRPRLKRIVSDLESVGSGGSDASLDEESVSTSKGKEPERTVIVHEVSPKDSLPGVALKYGISLADLRRANHLWPSDPIHLRKILYVPLDKSHKAKDIFLKLAEDNSASEEHSGQLPSFNASAEERRYPQHGLTIRKVPASTLSFFPPPQTSAGDDSIRDSQSDIRHTRPTRPTIPPDLIDLTEPHATAPASQLSILSTPPSLSLPIRSHLTSLFSALPIAPSTRESIVARLSLDSGTSTPTQYSEEQDHELDDVGRRINPPLDFCGESELAENDQEHILPAFVRRNGEAVSSDDHARYASALPLSTSKSPSASASTSVIHSLPRDKVSESSSVMGRMQSTGTVRTAQLEPSPVMQLPLRSREGERRNS
ncbi:hypothetical protein K474DRAFT_1748676 [Panus rudis PR-1116 ss-1]|nr:hypothetical protein K474DRAFT_1748676 [Panus rudis PR-1116 ss-1]